VLDNYHFPVHTGFHSSVNKTVTEKRAPTDESVRLLREMERAAADSVIGAIRLENTVMSAVIYHQTRNFGLDECYACIFQLNGKRHQADFVTDDRASRDDVITGIRDAIAKEVANAIASSAIKAMDPMLRAHSIGRRPA